ncbi:multidrug resistance-associated protein 5 isoform X2 [Ixodes scapularis]|uniref:multidrug resistance-associated protein 5 isoform X2 n=1 Tax=Ixodes scapularis TaxID=6945 RepID=UPI001C38F34D|nr:multidrug resistance-associated protein 5 isoform X2 [Ixodes scapularis]
MPKAAVKPPTDMHKWMSTGSLFLPYGTSEDYAQADEDGPTNHTCTMANADSLEFDTFKVNQGIAKYKNALKVLIPVRPHPKDKHEMPTNQAGLFSFISLVWLSKLMWKAYRQGIHQEDLWQMAPNDSAELNVKRLERLWKDEQLLQGEKAQFWMAAARFCKTRAIVAGVLICIGMTFQFLGPAVLLREILSFLEDSESSTSTGVLLACCLIGTQLVRSGCLSMSWIIGAHTAIRLQGAIQLLLYRRMLKVRIEDKHSGQVVNHVTNDMERIFDAAMNGMLMLGTPVMFLLTLVYSCCLIGPWALMGNFIILLFYPIMGGIAGIIAKLRRQAVKKTDARVHLMAEVVNNIRLIKMYAWELPFITKVADVRGGERSILVRGNFLQSLSTTVTPVILIMATVSTLLGYGASGNELSASRAFTIFALFNGMGFSIGTLPYAIRAVTEAKVALQRMQKLLELDEAKMWSRKVDERDQRFAVTISDATFTWQSVPANVRSVDIVRERFKGVQSSKPKHGNVCNGDTSEKALLEEANGEPEEALRDISLHITKGSLIGICGRVGSGKTSLLNALCGEMNLLKGDIDVNGNIAIATQQAWIFNATIRDNILFGLPYLKSRYDAVLDACCLLPDLAQFTSSDLTEIGERGVTLSGGQRQRISLARALYSDRDIFLLDDPLSAVDSKVANQLFRKCIQTAMQGKTVFLVSHSMHVLEKCQQVLFMKGGRIIERGTHAALMSFPGEYRKMFQLDAAGKTQMALEGGAGDIPNKDSSVAKDTLAANKDAVEGSMVGSRLVKEEEKAVGGISKGAVWQYVQACGGPCVVLLLALAFLAFVCSQMFANVWLQHWVDQMKKKEPLPNVTSTEPTMLVGFGPEQNSSLYDEQIEVPDSHSESYYYTVYGVTLPVMLFLGIIKGIACTVVLLAASSRLHNQMLQRVLRSPTSFFDVTPSGRITNRFSKDMDEMDIRIPFFLEMVVQSLLAIALQLLISVFVYKVFFVVLGAAAALYLLLDRWLNVGVREVKKLDNVARSSVVVHLSTTLQGISVIRVFDCHKWFTTKMYQLVNTHSVAHIVFHLASRWFTLRMELVGIIMVAAAAFIVVFTRSSVTTGLAGLVLTSVFSVCTFIPFIMRLKSELSARLTSMERIHEYCRDLREEAPQHLATSGAPPEWPSKGEIVFEEVCLRYREGLPLVLRSVSFRVRGGHKVGLVGRTGAGKSSFLVSLMRLQELESGRILLDGVDISKLGLHQLRSSVAVIPQDPVLFQGTVRYNLDPHDNNTDQELWEALDRAHLKPKIQKEEKQLESVVEKNGDNFSVGERQLLCLARALLRHNKVLVLDEATASVDAETDQLIQQTVRETFADCTVLTIAHRLNTVLSCDVVIVLDTGKVIEMDSPLALANDPNSVFASMLKATGTHSSMPGSQ